MACSPMQQSRRSACDRCRGQKLRCLREEGDFGSCNRCRRAKVICTTSPPRLAGRPSRSMLRDGGIRKSQSVITRNDNTLLASTSQLDLRQAEHYHERSSLSATPSLEQISASMKFPDGHGGVFHHVDLGQSAQIFTSAAGMEDAVHYARSPTKSESIPSAQQEVFDAPVWGTYDLSSLGISDGSRTSSLDYETFSKMPQTMSQAGSGVYAPPCTPIPISLGREYVQPSWQLIPEYVMAEQYKNTPDLSAFAPKTGDSKGFLEDLDDSSTTSESNLLEYCTFQLSDLNRDLHRQIRLIESHSWRDILTFNAHIQDEGSKSPRTYPAIGSSPIQDLFNSSQQLIDVVSHFITSAEETAMQKQDGFVSAARSEATPLQQSPRLKLVASSGVSVPVDADFHLSNNTSTARMAPKDGRMKSFLSNIVTAAPSTQPRPDTTTIILTLSCYVRLLRIYTSLFDQVHHLLVSKGETHAQFPNTHVVGLWSHKYSLHQVDLLTRLSCDILAEMKEAIGLPCPFRGNNDAKETFQNTAAMKFLGIVSALEEVESQGQHQDWNSGTLENSILQVRSFLDQVMPQNGS